MQSDDPPVLAVGTEVSAKFKGAFCEAKVKKVSPRAIKIKCTLKESPFGVVFVEEKDVKNGTIGLNEMVEVAVGKTTARAQINHIKDQSQYFVVFNDGDEKQLRRTQLCLKGAKHFDAAVNLDALPLYNPEQFGTPVLGGQKGSVKRKAHRSRRESSGDEGPSTSSTPTRSATRKKRKEKEQEKEDEEEDDSDEDEPPKREKRAAANAASSSIAMAAGPTDEETTELSDDGASGSSASSLDRHKEKERKRKDDKEEKTDKKEGKEKDDKPERKRDGPTPGTAICVYEDSGQKGKWFPAVVVSLGAYRASGRGKADDAKDKAKKDKHIPVRSFQNGKYSMVDGSLIGPWSSHSRRSPEPLSTALKNAVERAVAWNGKGILPPGWERAEIITDKADKEKEKKAGGGEKKGKKEDEKKKAAAAAAAEQSSSSSSSEEEDDEETDDSGEKNVFTAYLYQYHEERGTPINKGPVLGGKELDMYRFYKIVQMYGGYKRATEHRKWRRVMQRMKLDGAPGATPITVRKAYDRYLSMFIPFYKRLGWQMDDLSSTAATSSRKARIRAVEEPKSRRKSSAGDKDKKKEKGEEDKKEEKEKTAEKADKDKEKAGGERREEMLKRESAVEAGRVASASPARSTSSVASRQEKEGREKRTTALTAAAAQAAADKKEKAPTPVSKLKRDTDSPAKRERRRTESESTAGLDGEGSERGKRKEKKKEDRVEKTAVPAPAKKEELKEEEKTKKKDDEYKQANVLSRFYMGQKVSAYHNGRWYDARVVTVDQPSLNEVVQAIKVDASEDGMRGAALDGLRGVCERTRCFVHYLGWNSRYDEWIMLDKIKISHKDERQSLQSTRRVWPGGEARIGWVCEWSESSDGVERVADGAGIGGGGVFNIGLYRPRRISASQIEQLNVAADQLGIKKSASPCKSVSSTTSVLDKMDKEKEATLAKDLQPPPALQRIEASPVKEVKELREQPRRVRTPQAAREREREEKEKEKEREKEKEKEKEREKEKELEKEKEREVKPLSDVHVSIASHLTIKEELRAMRSEAVCSISLPALVWEKIEQDLREEKRKEKEKMKEKAKEKEVIDDEKEQPAETKDEQKEPEMVEKMDQAPEPPRKPSPEKERVVREPSKRIAQPPTEEVVEPKKPRVELHEKENDEIVKEEEEQAAVNAQEEEERQQDKDEARLQNEARDVLNLPFSHDDSDMGGSGAETPVRDNDDDTDTQSLAGSGHPMASPSPSLQRSASKKKRSPRGGNPSHMVVDRKYQRTKPERKGREGREEESDADDGDDEGDSHRDTFTAQKTRVARQMETDGTLGDETPLQLTPLEEYLSVPNVDMVAVIEDRMNQLRQIWKESKMVFHRCEMAIKLKNTATKKQDRSRREMTSDAP